MKWVASELEECNIGGGVAIFRIIPGWRSSPIFLQQHQKGSGNPAGGAWGVGGVAPHVVLIDRIPGIVPNQKIVSCQVFTLDGWVAAAAGKPWQAYDHVVANFHLRPYLHVDINILRNPRFVGPKGNVGYVKHIVRRLRGRHRCGFQSRHARG